MIIPGKPIYIQRQCHPDYIDSGSVGTITEFPYLFIRTTPPKKTQRASGFTMRQSPLSLLDGTDGAKTISDDSSNTHETGKIGFNATLIFTDELFEKYGERIFLLNDNNAPQFNLSFLKEAASEESGFDEAGFLFFNSLGFHELSGPEKEEIVQHLVVSAGPVETNEMKPIFVGNKASRIIQDQLIEEHREDELQAIEQYLFRQERYDEVKRSIQHALER